MISQPDTKQTIISKAQSYFDEGYACSHKQHKIICRQLVGKVAGMVHKLLEQNTQQ